MAVNVTVVVNMGNKNIPKGRPILVKHAYAQPGKADDWNMIIIDPEGDKPYGDMKRGPGVVFFEQITAWMEMPNI